MKTHRDILLDDYGMMLLEKFQDAWGDCAASLDHLRSEIKRQWFLPDRNHLSNIKTCDIWPRHDKFIDCGLRFMEHYFLLIKHPDIALRYELPSHCLIDDWAHQMINRVRLELQNGKTVEGERELMRQLLDTLQRSEYVTESVRR